MSRSGKLSQAFADDREALSAQGGFGDSSDRYSDESNPGEPSHKCDVQSSEKNSNVMGKVHDNMDGKGKGSFCLPRVVVDALIDQHANALEICTMLCLACYSDRSGGYTNASHSSVFKRTGANKSKNGPIMRAFAKLKKMRVYKKVKQPRGAPKKLDLGPLLYDRASWNDAFCGPLPDQWIGHENGLGCVKHVLPTFGESFDDRVWFSKSLVEGFEGFQQPLKQLLRAGDVTARLLLAMYAANDMLGWGGVRPFSSSSEELKSGVISRSYLPAYRGEIDVYGDYDVNLAKECLYKINTKLKDKVCYPDKGDYAARTFFDAFRRLELSGFVYEVVVVLDRDQTNHNEIAEDASVYYELDARSRHGYKPAGEHGLGWLTASTLLELGHSLSDEEGDLNGTYAAIVPATQEMMIIGLIRLRFRVSNSENFGVSEAFGRIRNNNKEAFDIINRMRKDNGLDDGKLPRYITL
jgi:hypothetical protein